MDIKVCDFCGKVIMNFCEKNETDGGVNCELKMLGNSHIKSRVFEGFPFSELFDVNFKFVLCNDCAKGLADAVIEFGKDYINKPFVERRWR